MSLPCSPIPATHVNSLYVMRYDTRDKDRARMVILMSSIFANPQQITRISEDRLKAKKIKWDEDARTTTYFENFCLYIS